MESGASSFVSGILFWYSYTQPNRASCTGTSFHSPLPGSGWLHCDMTPNAEKGTAHLPCYQNNTLADNYWIAFKHFCLHTSKNTLDYSFYSHVRTTSTKPSPAAKENLGPWRPHALLSALRLPRCLPTSRDGSAQTPPKVQPLRSDAALAVPQSSHPLPLPSLS